MTKNNCCPRNSICSRRYMQFPVQNVALKNDPKCTIQLDALQRYNKNVNMSVFLRGRKCRVYPVWVLKLNTLYWCLNTHCATRGPVKQGQVYFLNMIKHMTMKWSWEPLLHIREGTKSRRRWGRLNHCCPAAFSPNWAALTPPSLSP